jgi:hypothetical protein
MKTGLHNTSLSLSPFIIFSVRCPRVASRALLIFSHRANFQIAAQLCFFYISLDFQLTDALPFFYIQLSIIAQLCFFYVWLTTSNSPTRFLSTIPLPERNSQSL